MVRSLILLALAAVSYFGITFLIESKRPEVKELTSKSPIVGTKLHAHGLPDQIIGTFKIDSLLSQQWLDAQTNLDAESREYFHTLHASQSQFTFDGKSIWFINQIADIPVEILENTSEHVKFKMLEPSPELKGSLTFFLQWDDEGKVWFSNYSHLEDGQRKLYRACYRKGKD